MLTPVAMIATEIFLEEDRWRSVVCARAALHCRTRAIPLAILRKLRLEIGRSVPADKVPQTDFDRGGWLVPQAIPRVLDAAYVASTSPGAMSVMVFFAASCISCSSTAIKCESVTVLWLPRLNSSSSAPRASAATTPLTTSSMYVKSRCGVPRPYTLMGKPLAMR
eukprot:CAMPEP_0181169100 /NCGR_PEP_ID=MMETSP1096-20121128/632_1 /TAXON_ID=156174 ORGANISM="Chrysochromulina ericina, Strain CCMP281" /NCGR_SAMPLE_ID=MMETSP1096 /ASSEMBLY_ACC=CAM_ASM_000453 /LENGTH=164 /DNA_ID=CAMNT_0023256531 /DNA_START=346 /DNA_END=841 /DNA_ORIENTATION=-